MKVTVANDNGEPGYAPITLRIPDAADCAGRRRFARREGRPHPRYATCVAELEPWTDGGIDTNTSFQVESQPAPCMLFSNMRQSRFAGFSVKTRRMVSGIGPHEMAAWKEFETNPAWVDFDMQTARVAWISLEATGSYLSDAIALDHTGKAYTFEVKADASYYAQAQYAAIMAHAEAGFAVAGATHHRVTGPELRGSIIKRRNVDRAFGDRFTLVTPRERGKVANLLAKTDSAALGDVEELFSCHPAVARSKVHALLCARELSFALGARVDRHTAVTTPSWPETFIDVRALTASNDN